MLLHCPFPSQVYYSEYSAVREACKELGDPDAECEGQRGGPEREGRGGGLVGLPHSHQLTYPAAHSKPARVQSG